MGTSPGQDEEASSRAPPQMSVKSQPEFSEPMLQESFEDDMDLFEAIK